MRAGTSAFKRQRRRAAARAESTYAHTAPSRSLANAGGVCGVLAPAQVVGLASSGSVVLAAGGLLLLHPLMLGSADPHLALDTGLLVTSGQDLGGVRMTADSLRCWKDLSSGLYIRKTGAFRRLLCKRVYPGKEVVSSQSRRALNGTSGGARPGLRAFSSS